MSEKKRTTITKEDIEKSIGGNVEEVKTELEKEVEEVKTEPEKKVEEKTFAEKSVEAAANAALKAAITTNEEMSKREADRTYFIEKKNFMLNKCKNDEQVEKTVSKLYAPIIGRVYTFNLNCIPVTIYCDGKPHKYPKFIADIIDEKLAKISESNTYKEVIEERLDQNTF